jgi:putative transposase
LTLDSPGSDDRRTLRTDAKVAHQCVFDILWCTQYRLPVLEGQVETRLRDIITAVLAEKQAQLIDVDIRPNRVRLVVEASPQLGVHRLVKALKFESAQVLRNEFSSLRSRLPSLWTRSYLVATVGNGFSPDMIERYVDQQKGR